MKKLSLGIAMIFALLFLTSCNWSVPQQAFYYNSSQIYVHSESEDNLTFDIAVFSKEKLSEVKGVGIESTTNESEDFLITITDQTVDQLKKHRYKGLYTNVLSVELKPQNKVKECVINRLILNLNGQPQKIEFKTPIRHKFSGGNKFTEELRPAVIPNDFSSSFINQTNELFIYEFNASQNITLTKISCLDFLKIHGLTIWINDIKTDHANLPLEIKSGQNVKLGFNYTGNTLTEMDYVATNLKIEYTKGSDNTPLSNEVFLIFHPIYPIENNDYSHIDKMIHSIIKENNSSNN